MYRKYGLIDQNIAVQTHIQNKELLLQSRSRRGADLLHFLIFKYILKNSKFVSS